MMAERGEWQRQRHSGGEEGKGGGEGEGEREGSGRGPSGGIQTENLPAERVYLNLLLFCFPCGELKVGSVFHLTHTLPEVCDWEDTEIADGAANRNTAVLVSTHCLLIGL